MPPTLGDRLFHIIEAVQSIQDLIAGNSEEDIAKSQTQRLALERLFEIISEASRWIPADVKARETEIDWQRMADLGNVLRHAYHRVDVGRMLSIATADLPPLKAFVQRVIDEEKKK